jgi:hypothetical protein
MMSRPRAGWPASEKRQGTKSREVGHERCSGRYGDLAAASEAWRLDRSGGGNRFASKDGCALRGERAEGTLRDKICGATAGLRWCCTAVVRQNPTRSGGG